MIFVTVGTHEQQFNRLVFQVDKLKKDGCITEEVVIQSGYSTYIPKYCKWYNFLSCDEMEKYISKARIIVTHGGPSSFVMPLRLGKVPIVVPRQKKFEEHVNNHQVKFTLAVKKRSSNIIVVVEIDKLKDAILNYEKLTKEISVNLSSNNEEFNKRLEQIARNLLKE